MKQKLLNNIKNIYGWKTKRKIIVISVDDYGNVRLDSKAARSALDKAGLKINTHFDAYDTLETREDLEMLYETLTSVKDKNGNGAVFTPFALPCNIDFEKMAAENYESYQYELLPVTYQKLEAKDPKAYKHTWQVWQQGIDEGLMVPQFHGREHFNLKVFNEKLKKRDQEMLAALEQRSFTSIRNTGYATIATTAAFEFWEFDENKVFNYIISDGLHQFKKVYGYNSLHFNAPGGREHPYIHKILKEKGVKYIDTPLIKKEHLGNGSYKTVFNYTGKKNHLDMTYQVRNVVFEPTDYRGFNWVDYSLQQIETAFFWNRPAIISSHRVNFCGHIDPKNREKGIFALKELLKRIVTKWPEVEFMSSVELGQLIEETS